MVRAGRAPERCLSLGGCEPVLPKQPQRVAQSIAEGAQELGSDFAGLAAHVTHCRAPVGLWEHDCWRKGRLPDGRAGSRTVVGGG
eukprot:7860518-Lingulodinium_polyedra.AAC.1